LRTVESSGWSAGSQASANRNTIAPKASGSQRARPKKRWKALTCRQPTTPAAKATPVTVRRPGQCTQPAAT
jgi:hypothetical protein